ncbi:prephenate dehydrogenase [Anditalea andensis]|uniref:Prephenate dehydrogenase n=1 Tax=Anditalea andensis TaxID=1048983 RepID=A0A074KYC8_9BACT|nr:prephenate dehydrogenase [Anditalea andensis]KEO74996.1 prephenate dehydrogenase [Anditalea andensis]
MKKIHIIGLGLIGGSFALAIKKSLPQVTITGFDKKQQHQEDAKSLNLITEIKEIPDQDTDLILLATPADTLLPIALQLLENIGPDTLIIDFGSTKASICENLANHPKRSQFLAGHPIAGTEYSGPRAAKEDLLERKVFIICEMEKTDIHLKEKAYILLDALNMKLRFMDPKDHDLHLAFVSHLSHISSFMLGKTVLDKMDDESHIFDMAGSGFASTVRLSKSSPEMWVPIIKENKLHILEALGSYIIRLQSFQKRIAEGKFEDLQSEMENINRIKDILDLDK